MKDGKCFVSKNDTEMFAYNKNDAPCICVTGASRSKQHGRIHRKSDAAERTAGKADGTWTYADARNAGAGAVNDTFPECSEKCIAAQLDEYHKKRLGMTENTRIRANPGGKGALPKNMGKTSVGRP